MTGVRLTSEGASSTGLKRPWPTVLARLSLISSGQWYALIAAEGRPGLPLSTMVQPSAWNTDERPRPHRSAVVNHLGPVRRSAGNRRNVVPRQPRMQVAAACSISRLTMDSPTPSPADRLGEAGSKTWRPLPAERRDRHPHADGQAVMHC
jgi:hypothetical protein